MLVHWMGHIISKVYDKDLVDEVSRLIASEANRVGFFESHIPSVSLRMQCHIGPIVDDVSLLKPVCDAIEECAVVRSTQDIRYKVVLPSKMKETGEPDEIWLWITPTKEKVATSPRVHISQA